MDKKRVLILTSQYKAWPKNEPVLFLGDWCKTYSKRNKWGKLDHKTVPYHWDDRDKLFNDYKYLNKFHKRIIPPVSKFLNKIHNESKDEEFWNILIFVS